MRLPPLYDEDALAAQIKLQRDHHWDLEKSIAWNTPIDLNKPLVALDEDAILFPGASPEERLAISQMMGLIIASAIFELEECLLRLRKECWEDIYRALPVSPEFVELGDLFFEEEQKHSEMFRRYSERYAAAAGIDPETLFKLLPQVRDTRTEALVRQDIRRGGHSFWWIVATVEQEFLVIYHALRPFRTKLEPLYFSLHERHFEEEARHASFPYLMLQLLTERYPSVLNGLHVKSSLVAAQFLQTAWAVGSLYKLDQVQKLAKVHPLFDALAHAYPKLHALPVSRQFWKLFTSAPYVSPLLNLSAHRKIVQFAKKTGSVILPFPEYSGKKLVGY